MTFYPVTRVLVCIDDNQRRSLINRLAKEKSPYLLQHKDNPIWWFPWGEQAFRKAVETNKPIFLSVGYATCHWCHVMEGDSFEKQDVADILNEHFVAIKVDREERPDVDSIYMTALQSMTGQGGWPMSLVLTPKLEPFWSATFVPRAQFKDILTQIAELWNSARQSEITNSAAGLTQQLKRSTVQVPASELDFDAALEALLKAAQSRFDHEHGGFSEAPKFPPMMTLLALLRHGKDHADQSSLMMVRKTLDAMLAGGIHDHLGGGIHRYTTDHNWLTPHFEKMLYDNALFILVLTEAAQLFRSTPYKIALERAVDYISSDMTSKEGGFFSAEDADSEKTEGKFYLWTKEELQEVLTNDEFGCLTAYFEVLDEGNFLVDKRVSELEHAAGLREFERGNILRLKETSLECFQDEKLRAVLSKLNTIRKARVRPLLDTKILTSWCGLMTGALAKASRTLDQSNALSLALAAATFTETHLFNERTDTLYHRHYADSAGISGFLEDYAFFAFGLIELHQSTLDKHWLSLAERVSDKAIELFWDDTCDLFYDSPPEHTDLLFRTRDTHDTALPSANHMMLYNLPRLATLTQRDDYLDLAKRVFRQLATRFTRYPLSAPFFSLAASYFKDQAPTLKLPRQFARDDLNALHQRRYEPNLLLQPGQSEGFELCYFGRCTLPSADIEQVWQQLEKGP